MNPVESALKQAAYDAAVSGQAQQDRAQHIVDGIMRTVALDNGQKITAAGGMPLARMVAQWAQENQLSPGDAALILSSYVTGLLHASLGDAQLARAVAILLASGPRSE